MGLEGGWGYEGVKKLPNDVPEEKPWEPTDADFEGPIEKKSQDYLLMIRKGRR